MNVTDVGHLTSDADTGEDKMEKAAKKEGKSAEEIADYYLKIFREDFGKLNISEPNIWCRATEHIPEMLKLIEKLKEKGFAYETDDGIYFDTSKFGNYGKFARLQKEGLEAGKRIEMRDKKNKTDFALWKFSEQPGVRQQEWKAFGKMGFPGWHIECSAMSMKYLGEHFDLHTGGIDHIPVHHTNEIAQSEAATGKKFVNYWLHGAFLTFKGEKVSKSKGGLYTVAELEELGFKPLDYRYLCLTASYRSPLDFTLDNLKNAQNSYERMKNIISETKQDGKENKVYLEEFQKAIDDDLNMPKALQVLWKLVRDEKAVGKIKTIGKMDDVFGLDLLKKEKVEIPSDIKKIADERLEARKNKNWGKSDELRDKLNKLGWEIADTSEGYKLKRKGKDEETIL